MGGRGAALRGAEVESCSRERSCDGVEVHSAFLCAVMLKTRLLWPVCLPVLFLVWGKFPGECEGEASVCETGMQRDDGLV